MLNEQKNEEQVFKAAVRLQDPAERSAYVKEACGDDRELLARVVSLLKVRSTRNSFLDDLIPEMDITPENSVLSEAPGTIIDKYKLLEKIGEGGMAVVYMAEQAEPIRRKVALKIIKLGMDTKQVIARFEAERQALAIMDHPNIAKVIDAGATETGRPYFVMELVKGTAITDYCDKNNLSTKERLDLFVQVCSAVQHAHQKGIIHRDIKPTNVMVTLRDGKPVPKVIDFGIAKATSQKLTEKTLFTRYAQLIGTPAYMSPEQAESSELDIDTRTDIYSLGVLLYELITGTTPFAAEKLRDAGYAEIQRIIREEEPVKPSTKLSTLGETLTDVAEHRKASPEVLRKLVSGDLDWIVMKALEKDRTRRYETVAGLVEDIGRHLNSEPVLAAAPSSLYRMRKFCKRHKMTVAAGVAITVALALGAAGLTVGLVQANNQKKRAWASFERARDGLRQTYQMFPLLDAGISKDEELQRGAERLQHAQAFLQWCLDEITDDQEIRLELGFLSRQEGNIDVILGRYHEAELAYRRAVGVADKLVNDFPENRGYQMEAAFSKSSVGFALEAQGQKKEADEFHRASLGLLDKLGRKFTFGVPTNIGSIVNSEYGDAGPCLSADGLSLFFHSDRPGGSGNWDLWMANRETPDGEWSEPVNLGPQVNSQAYDGFPCISDDGLSLYFDSHRPGGEGQHDLWRTTRESVDEEWSVPENLGPIVNGPYAERKPSISRDGRSLYFGSNRPGGLGVVDLWFSTRESTLDSWSAPINLGPNVNGLDSSEYHPSISSDGLMLFFASGKGDTASGQQKGFGGAGDLWVATRSSTSDFWGEAENLGPPVNSVFYEGSPSISADGRMLYFAASLRPSEAVSWDSLEPYDLWQVPILSVNREKGK